MALPAILQNDLQLLHLKQNTLVSVSKPFPPYINMSVLAGQFIQDMADVLATVRLDQATEPSCNCGVMAVKKTNSHIVDDCPSGLRKCYTLLAMMTFNNNNSNSNNNSK